MTNNRSYFLLVVCLFGFGLNQIFAQSKRDSSNAEIKQQALEMREKLNKYMSDKLLEEKVNKDPGAKVFFDSISTIFTEQQREINSLQTQFKQLEKQLNEGVFTSGNPKKKREKMLADLARGAAFHWINDHQLNLYFPFDSYELSAEQLEELRSFLSSEKRMRVKINGYTDWVGAEKHNKKLARNRCSSAEKMCKEMKITYRISGYSKCDTQKVYSDETAKWCRRVEVILY